MSTCWPARCPGQSGSSSTRVRTRGVSTTISATVAMRHAMGRASDGGAAGVRPATTSLTRLPCTAAPSTDRHACGSPVPPRSRACRDRESESRAPTSRSSRNRDAARAAAPGRRAPGGAVCRRSPPPPTPCPRSHPREGDWWCTPVSYTHLRAHETDSYLVCRLLLEKKKKKLTSIEKKKQKKKKKQRK